MQFHLKFYDPVNSILQSHWAFSKGNRRKIGETRVRTIIISLLSLPQEHSIFGTSASLTYGPDKRDKEKCPAHPSCCRESRALALNIIPHLCPIWLAPPAPHTQTHTHTSWPMATQWWSMSKFESLNDIATARKHILCDAKFTQNDLAMFLNGKKSLF